MVRATATGFMDNAREPLADDLARLKLQPGRQHADDGNAELRARQIQPIGGNSERAQARKNMLETASRITLNCRLLDVALAFWLQQHAITSIEQCGTPKLAPIALVQCSIAGFSAFRTNNMLTKFHLAQLEDRRAYGLYKAEASSKAECEPVSVRTPRKGGDRRDSDTGSNVEHPALPILLSLARFREHFGGSKPEAARFD